MPHDKTVESPILGTIPFNRRNPAAVFVFIKESRHQLAVPKSDARGLGQ